MQTKILLVEDNPGEARLLGMMLASAEVPDLHVETADRLSVALERLAQGGIDVIVLDLALPDSWGIETFTELHRQAPEVPILVLTGFNDLAMATEAVRAGAQDYLIKGEVEPPLLARAVRYATERQRIEQKLRDKTRELAERVKELRCVCAAASVTHRRNVPLSEMLQELVELVPHAWRYPEITGARVVVEGQEVRAGNFSDSGWKQSADVSANGERMGVVEVSYLEERPDVDEGPFSREERELIDTLAAGLGEAIQRLRAEEGLRDLNACLDRRVAERTAELEAANRELESFSYSVSHDLRAPLRAIDGFGRILEEDFGSRLGSEGGKYLQRLLGAGRHMEQLIDGLLAISQVARSEMHRQQVDLSAMVREIAEVLRETHPEREVHFAIQEGIVAEGDTTLLRTVLENLVGNAWKYTSNSVEARIEFGVATEGDAVVYFVRDDGAGFDMEYAGRLFGVFQRLHNTDEFEGTGIGLATVQRIVHRHGGRVWAEGEVEHGATFYFTLSCIPDGCRPGARGAPPASWPAAAEGSRD